MFDGKKQMVLLLGICLVNTVVAYQYDPNDFATEVVGYIVGGGIPSDRFTDDLFDNPACALGRPTIDTTGDITGGSPFEPMTVVPLYPAFRYYEIVSIGYESYLTIKFSHPVVDDKNNLYGIDFIIFGNPYGIIDGNSYWHRNDDPNAVYVTGNHVHEEPGIVSVSQDGLTWHTFAHDPGNPNDLGDPNHLYADDFAPTLGRVYDPNNPDPCAFPGNLYWGYPTNPTLPIEPNLSVSDFEGRSVAEICNLYYGNSAGGTGFDISRFDLPVDESGLKWIQYVRVYNPRDKGATPEIDAIADAACCGDYKHPYPNGDISEDCNVGYEDLELLSSYWLAEIIDQNDPAVIADIYEDDIVNFRDWGFMVDNWGERSWYGY